MSTIASTWAARDFQHLQWAIPGPVWAKRSHVHRGVWLIPQLPIEN